MSIWESRPPSRALPVSDTPLPDGGRTEPSPVGSNAATAASLDGAAPQTSTPVLDAAGNDGFGDEVAREGQELVGVIPEGASVSQDGHTYRWRDGRWTLDGEPVPDFEVDDGHWEDGAWVGPAERNAGAQWLLDTIGFYEDDVSTGWCGTTAWKAIREAYLDVAGVVPGTPEYDDAVEAMEEMGLGLASPERILTTFGPGAAFGAGDTLVEGRFHAWNEETQSGSYYSRFLADDAATVPQTAEEAGAALTPGSVLVMDHKGDDFESDDRARLADHILTVEDTWVAPQNTNLVTFTSMEGNAGQGLVGDDTLATGNLVPVNKEYLLVPQDRDGDGVVDAWGAYSATLPLVVDGEERQLTVSELIEEGYVHVDDETTPQDVIDQIDAAVRTGGFYLPGAPDAQDGALLDEEADADGIAAFGLAEGTLDRTTVRGADPNVAFAQELLVGLGLLAGDAAEKSPGWYGPQTTTAVTGFQSRWNATHPDDPLPVTGAMDAATRAALLATGTGADAGVRSVEQVAIAGWAPSEYVQSRIWNGIGTDLIDGQLVLNLTTPTAWREQSLAGIDDEAPLDASTHRDRPAEVGMVQDLLVELGLMPDPGESRGWYGASTTNAVKAFQRAHGLPDTGVVDAATRDALVRDGP